DYGADPHALFKCGEYLELWRKDAAETSTLRCFDLRLCHGRGPGTGGDRQSVERGHRWLCHLSCAGHCEDKAGNLARLLRGPQRSLKGRLVTDRYPSTSQY